MRLNETMKRSFELEVTYINLLKSFIANLFWPLEETDELNWNESSYQRNVADL